MKVLILHDPLIPNITRGHGISRLTSCLSGFITGLGGNLDVRAFAPGELAAQLPSCDAVILLGHESPAAVSNADIQAFEKFVLGGGGCFASGDHGNFGDAMCGALAGISQMRHWSIANGNPDALDPKAIDTRPGVNDEEDLLPPKEIFPTLDKNGFPHRLLIYSKNTYINHLPDHAHEGDCRGANLIKIGAFQDSVHTVAFSVARTVHGGFAPELRPIIRCVEPSQGCGPLVVDSTIHHWLNESRLTMSPQDIPKLEAYYHNVAIFILGKKLTKAAIAIVAQKRAHALVREIVAAGKEKEAKALCSALIARNPEEWRVVAGVATISPPSTSNFQGAKLQELKAAGYQDAVLAFVHENWAQAGGDM